MTGLPIEPMHAVSMGVTCSYCAAQHSRKRDAIIHNSKLKAAHNSLDNNLLRSVFFSQLNSTFVYWFILFVFVLLTIITAYKAVIFSAFSVHTRVVSHVAILLQNKSIHNMFHYFF